MTQVLFRVRNIVDIIGDSVLCLAPLGYRVRQVMLFKPLSASVYGVDAYLVEVEVDVGSADMEQFNVVGLPGNAVKESLERIKARVLDHHGFCREANTQAMPISEPSSDRHVQRREPCRQSHLIRFHAAWQRAASPIPLFLLERRCCELLLR